MESRPRITFPMSCEPRGSLSCLDANTRTPKYKHEDVFSTSSIYAPPADIKPDNYHLRLQEQLAPLKASSFSNAPLKAEPTEAIIPEERPRFTSGDRVIVRVTTNDEGRWVHGVVVDLSWFRARPTADGGVAYPVKYRDGATVVRRFDPDKGEMFRDPFSMDL
ncbi:hypothetical protein TRAPUB_4291 [Trametes pubescens]|uniref:Uncharacterized protein n=1 Tax=Trametes pubescens TaxID=154538 RepID=A0A1M2VBI6_TRAPU|nr:hypothetical protein TRAPUB_4291 [Trametes pubescens]